VKPRETLEKIVVATGEMEQGHNQGVLMRGLGRRFVYSRARAWLGMAVELPSLLRGVSIPYGANCLDIATGLGWATAGLIRLDPSVRIVALDYDGTILPRTSKYLREHGAAESSGFCRADGKYLPFRDASFDLVLCLYGLHHFRGYLEALREIARVLRPTGTFALIDPTRRPGKPPGGHHGMEFPRATNWTECSSMPVSRSCGLGSHWAA
jgi:ubiquinone/menaquinone biosynthesis C-methylase UbiE